VGAVSAGTIAGTIAATTVTVIAQTLPTCQPPRSDEYLLLVPNQRPDTQAQLQKLLPSNAVLTPCNYLNANVVRVEGFASAEIATAWAQYIAESVGLQAYVARPAPASSIAATPAGASSTSSPAAATTPAYNPQPLGAGFAVVVNYFNKPELAASVRQVTTRDVGLVAFEQQPYLLAAHTTDATAASNLLRSLSERGLTAAIIDSRRVVLLTPTVKIGN
jgi:hypothetical protein